MIDMTIKELAEILNAEITNPVDIGRKVAGINIDSRTVKPGEIFAALAGDNVDGHAYIASAAKSGAIGIIADDPARIQGFYENLIMVNDARKALFKIAASIRGKLKIPVIAITGTNGKTTVKNFVTHLLSSKYNVLASPKSFNNDLGLSLTMFSLLPEHEILVMELGTNHPGEIAALAEVLKPEVAIITNIGSGHLGFFENKENVFNEKASLLRYIAKGGIAVLCGDDIFLESARSGHYRMIFYGTGDNNSRRIQNVSCGDSGQEFILGDKKYTLPFCGEHNVYNAVSAIIVAEYFGIDDEMIGKSIAGLKLPPFRM
ncbi:MAG: UDP-N-acetylmuramoyl-tripeptide--D-alanyl-D-alanine ligase, partial [Candidatus Omnitrophica bacterium]|nr:UDP-N-acetylmuramoyl-tripeptide--D-alanyl-D-alanine ligase [Candidatus Omnitrophota bacterium]